MAANATTLESNVGPAAVVIHTHAPASAAATSCTANAPRTAPPIPLFPSRSATALAPKATNRGAKRSSIAAHPTNATMPAVGARMSPPTTYMPRNTIAVVNADNRSATTTNANPSATSPRTTDPACGSDATSVSDEDICRSEAGMVRGGMRDSPATIRRAVRLASAADGAEGDATAALASDATVTATAIE